MGFLARREIWLSAALAMATGLSYAGVLANDFINLDDNRYVYNNRVVQMGLSRPSVTWAFTNTELSNWHPLTWLSLELDYQLFGLNPAGYHATNLLFHIANSVLLFWLLRHLTGAAGRSTLAAALFALHPLHVESVAWISERKDVLSTFFFLLSVFFWQIYARRSAVWSYALAVTLFVLSLMAKAMGVTLPLILLLLDVWPLRRWPGAAAEGNEAARQRHSAIALVTEKLPFLLISAAFAAVTVLAQGQTGAMEYGSSLALGDRLMTVPVNYVTYLWQTIWPTGLAILYPHPGANLPLWKPLAALSFLLLITVAVVRVRREFPYLFTGWFWYLTTLLPVIGLVQLGRQATADRYMYMPMVGLLIMLCWGCYDLAGERRWVRRTTAALGAVLVFLCAELTARQLLVWRDDISMWKHTLAVTSPTTTACVGYALALGVRGQADEAEHWFRKALEIDPTDFAANVDLGIEMGKKGRHAEAVEFYQTALKSKPNDPLALEYIGLEEEEQGHLDAAIDFYEQAAHFNPHATSARQRLDQVRRKKAEGSQ